MTMALIDTPSERPLGRAVAYLAGLGAFFYLSYGFTNWLAGTRTGVPAVVFDWERHVPFLAWTIVPYWSTNLFYALSLLFSRTRAELDVHAKRLLTAQLVAVFFFIVAPLKFSWPKPETEGFFGFMFEALGAFDKPFNQAPSLHVALTVILVAQFAKLLPRPLFPLFAAWSTLVIASVMTTFQHHFIDIPTGALLGLACVWLWRDDGTHAFAGFRFTQDPSRRKLATIYLAGSLALAFLAILFGSAVLWLLWPALSLFLVAAAYAALGPAAFMKDRNGMMGWPARILLAPYLAGAWLNSRLWTLRAPNPVEIAANVHLGRFPDADDAAGFRQIIDLTAEFTAPATSARWTAQPMLDLVAPDARSLRRAALAIEVAQGPTPILVCCALGYGRSVAAIVVWLVLSRRVQTLAEALALVKARRPGTRLGDSQLRAIEAAISHE